MRLIRAPEALKKYFGEGQIDPRSLNEAIERGDVPGQVWRNGRRPQYWVDADAFERSTGNDLVDRVLEKAG